MSSDVASSETPAGPRWRPLSSLERRIVGVLIEKAKTTPDQYPLSLNALRSGCNQKSNRDPVMEISEEQIEPAIERLRESGGMSEIMGGGRVARYRHLMYEWLGVDKVELAIMAELLLRGPQSEGDLRGRASRMEPIADLTTLRTLLEALKRKGLVVGLTPEGRGHMITHALYRPEELARIRTEVGQSAASSASSYDASDDDEPVAQRPASPVAPRVMRDESRSASHSGSAEPAVNSGDVARMRQEMTELREQVAQLRHDLEELSNNFQRSLEDVYQLRESLGG